MGPGLTRLDIKFTIFAVMMMGWVNAIAAALVIALPHVCLPGSLDVVVNEVLYDPEGRDTGLEFIELHNRTDGDICLYYYEVATGNGAYENKWKGEWQGTRSDTIRARGFFVIGEENVVPSPDHVTSLDLQNGPDACRLLSPESEPDVVGWGAHDYDEYYETAPAPCASSGASLGRDPDGADTGDNSADFAVFPVPTPGGFNRPPCDLAVDRACLSRYSRPDHAVLQLIARVSNLGTAACGEGAVVHAACAGSEDSSVIDAGIAPGASERVSIRIPNVGAGLHRTLVWLGYPADSHCANDSLAASIIVWPGPAAVNEFMFKPASGACEWIEVLNRSDALVDLEGWTLEDSGGRRRAIAAAGICLAPGGYLMLVEDEAGFKVDHPECDCRILKPSGGWPTLNDTDGRDGYADMIVLRDSFGTCVDSVAYSAAWGEPGFSVERIDALARSAPASNWSPHYGSGGCSPGRSNSVSISFPEPGGYLKLGKGTFSPDGDGRDDLLSVSVEVPAPAVVRLKVFDVNGRPFKTLIDGDLVEERRITFWDGRVKGGGLAPIGVYVLLLEAKPVNGGSTLRSKLPAVLVRK
jgi:hypothetical protein